VPENDTAPARGAPPPLGRRIAPPPLDRRAALGLPPVAAPLTLWDRLGALADALGTSPARLAAGAAVALAVAAALAWTVLAPSSGAGSASSRAAGDAALPRATPSSSGAAGTAAGSAEVVVVYAAGAVVRPGLYKLTHEARVADVLDAAGGPGPDADLDQMNLAALVADGERVYVPRKGERPPEVASGSGAGPPGAPAGPVNLNSATAEQLDALPGIGPSTARAIIEWRTQHGRFKRVDDLLNVRGIGPAKLDALRSQVRV
jgi:competence protein ComEA